MEMGGSLSKTECSAYYNNLLIGIISMIQLSFLDKSRNYLNLAFWSV